MDKLEKETLKFEQIAIKNGHNIGDKVFNKKLGLVNTIVKTAKEVIEDKNGNLCTLGSVGEYADNFTKYVKSDQQMEQEHYYFTRQLKNMVSNAESLIRKSDFTLDKIIDYIKKNVRE